MFEMYEVLHPEKIEQQKIVIATIFSYVCSQNLPNISLIMSLSFCKLCVICRTRGILGHPKSFVLFRASTSVTDRVEV